MKIAVREMIYLLFYSMIVLFVLRLVFFLDVSGERGAIGMAGYIYREADTEKTILCDSNSRIKEVQEIAAPKIRYRSRLFIAGEEFSLKELFEVKLSDSGEYVSAAVEQGFTFVVVDIRDSDGNSCMADFMEDGASEEVPWAVTYDRETGNACFNKSGMYVVRVLVWGENGRTASGEIQIPVETEAQVGRSGRLIAEVNQIRYRELDYGQGGKL